MQAWANIKQVGNVVIIEGDSKEEFFKNSRNKVFFTSSGGFGFEVKKKGKNTIWEGIVEEEADLNEILTFIDKEKQKTKADSAIKKIATNRKQKQIAHTEITKIGKKIKISQKWLF